MFKRVKEDSLSTRPITSLKGNITLKYKEIVKVFGEPDDSDQYKVSGQWVFKSTETDEYFTIYDWKATNLYDEFLPSVSEFRNSDKIFLFNVGGNTTPASFMKWINNTIRDVIISQKFEKVFLEES